MRRLPLAKLTNLLKKDVVLSLLGNGVSTVLSLLTFTLLARWLKPVQMGEYMYLYTIYTLFDTIRTGLLFNALLQQGAAATTETAIRRWEGAVWQINLLFSAAVMLAGVALWSVSRQFIEISVISMGWLVAVSFLSIPGNIAGWMLLARARFVPMQVHKLVFPIIMTCIITAIHFTVGLDLPRLLMANLATTALVSIWSWALQWCFPLTVLEGTKSERKHLFQFGKYSIGALLGSSLLRNSDIYLIRYFIGNEAVALYSVPQRLIQIIEIPLRSVVSASIPAIVKTFHHQSKEDLTRLVAREAGVLTLILVPVSLGGFLLADYLVLWLAGNQYEGAAWLVRIFMIYSLLMPLDRYLGVTLDAIGKPQANMKKMIGMLVVNVVGDISALWFLPRPEAVACITILTFGTGIVIGMYYVRTYEVALSLKNISTEGMSQIRKLLTKERLQKIPGLSFLYRKNKQLVEEE